MAESASLRNERSFWGVITTQFLGALNDNLFKMLLLLICTDYVMLQGDRAESPYFDPFQTVASLLFALAFVLISGFAGYLSDRFPKRRIIVICKVGEIVVMTAGLIVFLTGTMGSFSLITALFAVLFLMGSQSAFFGPPKYGILPELFSDSDLPQVNGVMLATTFAAIIFGTALAGVLKTLLGDQAWVISAGCVALAIVGTVTATLIRPTEAALPSLQFKPKGIFVEPTVWRMVFGDRLLLKVLVVYSVFWFVGGVLALVVTLIGRIQMDLTDLTTSLFNASIGVGIGAGSMWAARSSQHDIRLSLVSRGSIGLFVATTAASIIPVLPISTNSQSWGFGIALLIAGFFGGWIAVPLQVFIQAHPPAELKGRVLAAMNLMTWVGILSASLYYFAALAVTGFRLDPSWILLSIGFIMLAAGVTPRLVSDEHLSDERLREGLADRTEASRRDKSDSHVQP